MARESFEVYYHQAGRWQLHMSFEANQRELAIEEAQVTEAKTGLPTRVVRETFHSESNTSEEAVSWQSAKAKTINDSDSMFGAADKGKPKSRLKGKAPPPGPQRQAQPRPAEAAPAAPAPKAKAGPKPAPQKKKKRKSSKGLLSGVFMAMLTSIGIAAILAVLVALVVTQARYMGIKPPENQGQLLFGTFILVFFFAFLVNLHRRFGLLSMLRGQPRVPQAAPQDRIRAMTAKPQPVQDVEFDQVEVEDLRAKVEAEDAEAEAEELEAEEAEDDGEPQELEADMGAEVHGEPEMPPSIEEAPQAAPQPAHAAPRQPEKPAEKPVEKAPEKAAPPPPPPKSPAEIEARTGYTKFVSEVMAAAPRDLNAFSRFGLNLFLAGAGSVIGQSKKLPRDIQLSVLKDGLQAAGNSAERAESFCVELPTHGKNPRYAGMIQAGVKAMNERMSGSGAAAAGVTALLNDWNLPEKRPAVPSVITFVFTDIVGSTEMTARLGNAGAQKAVRAHNTAVRSAIQAKKGREVKHTGDGIMATFPDPAAAVTGAIQMQRDIAAHNSANPTLQVHVRIGVNVGEAVEEENDFFGAAVQMTARICDKASKGNVWVSQAVVDACKGQRLGFIPRGRFEMKGIQGAKTLYEVGWTDAHKNELADL